MQQTVQVPKTAAELAALRHRRDELESQLQALTDRRQQLLGERATASSFSGNQALVGELDAQIRELSARVRRVDAEKLAMDDAVSAALKQGVTDERVGVPPGVPAPPAMAEVMGIPSVAGGFDPSTLQQRYERMMVLEGVGFLLLGFVLWRWGVRRGRRHEAGAQTDAQLRQAVDAIAIEVERISENQRYVTKLLSEQNQASPVSRPQSEAERVGRETR